jgi:cyclic beta-1,2-glucan synthetase
LNPCIPPQWPGFRIDFRHGSAWYEIVVENPGGVSRGVASTTVDGVALAEPARIALQDDGVKHQVKVVLG